jgi:MSHA pilin protein MshC
MKPQWRTGGFTLVELIVTMVLIGVLSSLSLGLFVSRSAFSPLLATQQLASATLLAQQAALAGNPASTLIIEQQADDFRFTVGPGTGSPRVFEISREGTSLSAPGGLPVTLTFGADGMPVSRTNLNLTFTGDSSSQTCISSLGAVYAGGCQP